MLNYTLNISTNEEAFIEQLYKKDSAPQFNPEEKTKFVFSNKKYKISLIGNIEEILTADIFINENKIDSRFKDGIFEFDNEILFLDIFGYATISVEILLKDLSTIILYTRQLKVLIDKADIVSVKSMLKYIYENSGSLLFLGNTAFDSLSIIKKDIFSIDEQMELLEDILDEYKKNFLYFKNNKHSKLQNVEKYNAISLDNVVGYKTLTDISRHPYCLGETNSTSGIQFEDRYFIPNTINSFKKEKIYNVYENIMIVSFIYTIFIECKNLSKYLRENTRASIHNLHAKEYVQHDDVIKSFMADYFNGHLEKIDALSIAAQDLFFLYKNEFKCEHEQLFSCPNPTPIFMGVAQYYSIFKLMYHWFNFNNYNFESENFLLSFAQNNKIYEYFILLKFIKFFRFMNFSLISSTKFLYDKMLEEPKFPNTFVFKNDETKITLYFQPTVFCSIMQKNNDINVIRNNVIFARNFYNNANFNNCYFPDFIIKAETGKIERYLIIDTKFSRQKIVKEYYLEKLIFKYIFSLMPCNGSVIQGLCVVNGKKDESDRKEFYSVYTSSVPKDYIPSVNICTIYSTNTETEANDFEKIKLAIAPLFL